MSAFGNRSSGAPRRLLMVRKASSNSQPDLAPGRASSAKRDDGVLDVTVVLLEAGYASTAIGPIEVFHSAGVLWNWLHGTEQQPRFRVRTASIDGGPIGEHLRARPHSGVLDPRHQADRHRDSSRVRLGRAGSDCATHRAPALAAQVLRPGSLHRGNLHRRRIPRRMRIARRPPGDDALGGGGHLSATLSQGAVADRAIRDRGPAESSAAAASMPRSISASISWKSSAATK